MELTASPVSQGGSLNPLGWDGGGWGAASFGPRAAGEGAETKILRFGGKNKNQTPPLALVGGADLPPRSGFVKNPVKDTRRRSGALPGPTL